MRGKVVTVFGGSGFIGRHLIRRLATLGAVIRVPTRNSAAAIHLKPLGDVGQIVFARGDLANDAILSDLIRGADHVVNLIGILHEGRAGDFERLQAVLPGRIARHAAELGVGHFVQLSAIGADPASPALYGRTKAAGEVAARAGFPGAVIFRPSIVFGPGDGFFNRFAALSRFAPALPLIGGGHTRFQPVYVDDVAEAIVAGLTRPELAGRTFELGGPRTYSFKELLQYLLRLLGRPRLLVGLPWNVARAQARLLEFLPEPPLTRDQVALLARDNVVAADAATLADLGIVPTPLELIVPTYLGRTSRLSMAIPFA